MNPLARRVRYVVIGVAMLWYATTALVFALRLTGPDQLTLISGLSLTVSALSAGLAATIRARTVHEPRTRAAWHLLGGASLAWGSGQVVTLTYEVVLGREVPFPSLADLGYLLAVPLFALGLLFIAMPTQHLATRIRAILDGLLISTALLLVSWVGVLGPVSRTSMDGLATKVVLLAYPVGDVVIFTLVLYVVLRVRATGARPALPLGLIAAALTGFAVADSGYAYLSLTDAYTSGSVIDAGWLGGFTMLVVAAVLPPRTAEEGPVAAESRPLGMFLPYIVITLAVVASLVLAEVSGRVDSATMWMRSTLILLIVTRQVITLNENARLTRNLERRVEDRTAELRRSQERFRAMVEHSSDVVSLIHPDGRVLYQSESSRRVFGHAAADLLDQPFDELLDGASRAHFRATVADVSQSRLRATVVELRLLHGDGGWRQIETTVTNLLEEEAVAALVLNSRDVSERRELETQLVHQAFHDSLTGLANRALFQDRVRHAIRRRVSASGSVAVVFLDLDNFKEVNDSLGHASGDALLIAVAERLSGCLDGADTIARLGGDEFAVLVEDAPPAVVGLTAERLRGALTDPVMIDGRELAVRASIGIAIAAPDTDDAEQLIRNADLAMYQAKDHRDGEIVFYDPSMHSSVLERLELEADLRAAVRDGQLRVHYQPTYALDSGSLVAVEALVRWTHPGRGEVPPGVFIPVAEQTGLIHEIGHLVLEEAARQGKRWQDLAPDHVLTVAVNVSGRQLQRAGFADEVRDVLAVSGLTPERLVLEMTESVLLDDTDVIVQTLLCLRAVGVKIAIDDFGTGYSSLSYLHRLPVDILKIDRSFIEQLSAQGQDSLVHSIVELGRTLRLETIAEGIEDHSQLLALRRLGCQRGQGYHFGRPGPPELVTDLLVDAVDEGFGDLEDGVAASVGGSAGVPGPREPEGEDAPVAPAARTGRATSTKSRAAKPRRSTS